MDEEKKKTVLDDTELAGTAGGEEPVPENMTCPMCGSTNVIHNMTRFLCLDCGCTWV